MNFDNEQYQHIDRSARLLWTIHACFGTAFLIGLSAAAYIFLYRHAWIFALAAAYALIRILIMPAIEYRQWRYMIAQDRIEIIHGIFFVKRILIPINRIQHLKIRQGILQKRFDLSTVDIYTAGGAHEIDGLRYEEADRIVRNLNRRVLEETMPEEAAAETDNEASQDET